MAAMDFAGEFPETCEKSGDEIAAEEEEYAIRDVATTSAPNGRRLFVDGDSETQRFWVWLHVKDAF